MEIRDATDLAPRLRALLERLPAEQLPITYQQAAEALGLSPPRTIQRVALALEALMREDVAAGRPLIAVLVVSRRGDLPRQGFFEQAVELGRFPTGSAEHVEAYRREREKALKGRG
ncbi:hypothetical protein [uncultured Halomonas sp.]|uniref:hypothetical protein n=1 Tax=uncultured Halomonas sp. TaxID=173971 RepID=UPI002631F0A6|nr:hypothetical protein [uncultured Halomonas sp.]